MILDMMVLYRIRFKYDQVLTALLLVRVKIRIWWPSVKLRLSYYLIGILCTCSSTRSGGVPHIFKFYLLPSVSLLD